MKALSPTIIVLFLLVRSIAEAQTHWVAKNGNDSNGCTSATSPCLTVQGAIGKVSQGSIAAIWIGPGRYDDPINIYYYRAIAISGDCTNRASTVLSRTTPGVIVWVQDHSIGSVSCLTLESGGSGVAGIATRQFGILDYGQLRFGAMPGGTHVAATDMSKVNCGNENEIAGGATAHVSAGDLSSFYLPCTINVVAPDVRFEAAMIVVNGRSLFSAQEAVFGGYDVSGKKYIVHGSELRCPAGGIPGLGAEVGDNGVVKGCP
jgi:hypothetical protein